MKKIVFGLFTFIFSFILINNVNANTLVIDKSTDSKRNEIYNYFYNNSNNLLDFNNKLSSLLSNCGIISDFESYNKLYFITNSNLIQVLLLSKDLNLNSFKLNKNNYFTSDFNFSISLSIHYDFDSKSFDSACNSMLKSFNSYEIKFLSSNFYIFYSDVPITIDYTGSPYDSVNYFGNLITDNVIFYKDVIGGSKMPIYYTVKFNIPNGASLELKDSKGNIINSSSNNTFSLESGNYTYSVTKSDLYISKENIELVVNKDMEINVELESKLNLTNYSNIFSKFYGYLGSVVPIVFGIEKPFFLIVLGVSVVIIIVLLIKKLLKGRF